MLAWLMLARSQLKPSGQGKHNGPPSTCVGAQVPGGQTLSDSDAACFKFVVNRKDASSPPTEGARCASLAAERCLERSLRASLACAGTWWALEAARGAIKSESPWYVPVGPIPCSCEITSQNFAQL